MRNIFQFRHLAVVFMMIVTGAISMVAQNLTAAQMNIYFGHPKKVIQTNSQGTTITEFDRDGRVMNVIQGNMRAVYKWHDAGKKVTLSMYQGPNLQDSGVIVISEMTKNLYKYNMGGMADVEVTFKENGAMLQTVMTNPQMSMAMKYLYRDEKDMYPYAVEQSMGDQSVKGVVTIDKTDSCGNAVEFSQEVMGQKAVTSLTIEYYKEE